jgi:pyridinium-3,5-biscarboxylic acid mononucleotide sulfurtransferase
LDEKLTRLQDMLRQMGSVMVAYSGGVDSTFLLKVAHDVLGDAAIGVTADSPSMARSELREAQDLATQMGARHVCLPVSEMSDERYQVNGPDRCYFCKLHVYDVLTPFAREHGYAYIVDGNNADDIGDHRPGRKAAAEFDVRSPLLDVGMTKAEIRTLSRSMGLATWDKPAAACLSSRLPYGTRVTVEALSQVERAEIILRGQGFRQLRVRHHGDVARLELEPADFARAIEQRSVIVAALKEIGYTYVTMDLSGFRSGSLNEMLKK